MKPAENDERSFVCEQRRARTDSQLQTLVELTPGLDGKNPPGCILAPGRKAHVTKVHVQEYPAAMHTWIV